MEIAGFQIFTFLVVCGSELINHVTPYSVNGNPYRHREVLDRQGKYQLEWIVDRIQKRVTFKVTCETRGYIGFGLSDNGKMTGADIVIGGVFPNGQAYFSDRHAVANQMPEEDPNQNWVLLEVYENTTHTFLSFSRDFDTCDPQDYQITEDKVTIIWSYAQRDELIYHHQNRGAFNVYLLHPENIPRIEVNSTSGSGRPSVTDTNTGERLQVWSLNSMLEMPAEATTVWCTMHQAPALAITHHVVGMDVQFETDLDRRYIYNLIVYKCNTPKGGNLTENEMFSDFVSHRGQSCLNPREPTGPMPTEFCTELFMGWARGGRAFYTPPHVGIPFASSPNEYYLLQIHYDNPNKDTGQVVNVNVDFFYTSQLRANEGGMLNLRHTTPGRSPSLLIPPSSIDHKIYGICGIDCTREILPKRGIQLYGVIFHTHNSGRKMKLHHFRQTRELPWIASDDNFRSDYQHHRMLAEERTVLPWDVLVVSCVYDNTWTNGTVVGGYSSRQEVCAAFLLYYNRIHGYQECSSEIGSSVDRRRLLGITNITWSNSQMEFLVTDKKSPLRGMTISHVSDNYVNWTVERRNELQKFQLTEQQVNWCFREVYAGGPRNPPETELIPPRPKRQKQPSRSLGKKRRRRRQLTPTVVPKYEPEWEDPRRYTYYPKKAKPYLPLKRNCSCKNKLNVVNQTLV